MPNKRSPEQFSTDIDVVTAKLKALDGVVAQPHAPAAVTAQGLFDQIRDLEARVHSLEQTRAKLAAAWKE